MHQAFFIRFCCHSAKAGEGLRYFTHTGTLILNLCKYRNEKQGKICYLLPMFLLTLLAVHHFASWAAANNKKSN